MSWLFSRALVEAFSEARSLDGLPSAQLSLMPTPQPFLLSDKTMAFSRDSQFGLTCRHLTESYGEAVLMWFLEASHARTSAPQDEEQGSRASDPAYGWKWPASFAKYDPASRSWRTRQCSLLGGLEEFSETWPRWGSMFDGECSVQPMPVLRISESESGLWQTPVADDAVDREKGKVNSRGEPKLSAQVKQWPTPTVNGNYNRKGLSAKSGDGLATAVANWPTPHGFSKDGRSNGPSGNELGRAVNQRLTKDGLYTTPCADDTGHRKAPYAQGGVALSAQVGGSLNPTWVEWLMGWTLGWTDLKPLGTDKYQQWLLSHGAS